MKLFVFGILFFCYASCFSQVTINGSIVSDKDSSPLPFATIQVASKSKGTVSNLDGLFALTIQQENSSDTLLISYIGYAPLRIPIQQVLSSKAEQIFRLKESIISLDEVSVMPLDYLKNPNKIVEEAIKRIPMNGYTDEFTAKGFFRQVHREDDTYKRLIEAALVIHDKGYHLSNTSSRIDIPELRKSYDLREINTESMWSFIEGNPTINRKSIKNIGSIFSDTIKQQETDIRRREQKYASLRSFLSRDLVRSHLQENDGKNFGFLNKNFVRNHKFKLDSIATFNNSEVYVVKILPSSRSEKYQYNPRSLIIPVGKIYIRTSDFAVLRIDYNYIVNPKKKGSQDYNMLLNLYGSGLIFSTAVTYSDYNGKLHLSSIRTYEPDPIAIAGQRQKNRESGHTQGYFFLERTFIITEVITDKNEVTQVLANRNWNEDIYSSRAKYNAQFWENTSILKETAEEQKLIQDLEDKVKLHEQFEKNK